ncbi:MAG TPA: hypothetical protein VHT91_05845 [Kofleriaceae bacterium]|jgi:hypothetical protein|nr:hypothetical protein [Kofleriaceae bacterium]
MSSRAYLTIIVLAWLAGRAGADDGAASPAGTATPGAGASPAGTATPGTGASPAAGAAGKDDGFFTRIKILGSTTGQVQKDNATLSGGLGLSAENTRHFLYLLINSGLNQKPPASGAPATSYGQFVLSPPTTDLSLTLRYRYFLNDDDLTLGAYAQLDVGRGELSATIAGAERTSQGFAVAIDAGAAGKMVISRQRSIQLFVFTGLSSRLLGGDAARDDDLKLATLMTTQTAFFGVNGSLLLQLGEVYAGLQLSYLSGNAPGLSGAQIIPVVGLRGGFDISTGRKAAASRPVSPAAVPAKATDAAAARPAQPPCVIL